MEISRSDLRACSVPEKATITNVRQLAAYNWLDKATPTIAVPGCPSLWTPRAGATTVRQDAGLVYIDQNAARCPQSPLEPLFAALDAMQPSFDVRPVDVVTDRSNLRKLLHFVNPYMSALRVEPFTMGVEVVGTTALFTRQEAAGASEVIPPSVFKEYGRQFEKAYTTDEIPGSAGHHEIVSYRFGGMNMVVRYEADGYVGDATTHKGPADKDPDADPLAGFMASLSLAPTSQPEGVSVQRRGRLVPHDSILELKTRARHRSLPLDDVAPQLWVSQTSKLVRAYHERGTFHETRVEDVGAAMARWESQYGKELQSLAALLGKIAAAVQKTGGSGTVHWHGGDKLVITKGDAAKKALPAHVYARWEETKKGEAGGSRKTNTPPGLRVVEAESV